MVIGERFQLILFVCKSLENNNRKTDVMQKSEYVILKDG